MERRTLGGEAQEEAEPEGDSCSDSQNRAAIEDVSPLSQRASSRPVPKSSGMRDATRGGRKQEEAAARGWLGGLHGDRARIGRSTPSPSAIWFALLWAATAGGDLSPVAGPCDLQNNVCSHATRLAVSVSAGGHLLCDHLLGRFSVLSSTHRSPVPLIRHNPKGIAPKGGETSRRGRRDLAGRARRGH
jgi:hypothetical protein